MKEFKGTFISLIFVAVLTIGWFLSQPPTLIPTTGDQLFDFEKHELTKVEIQRPDDESLVLIENGAEWFIEETDYLVSRSMVNRIKHQLHDLSARALVDEAPESPSTYGLGDNGIHVILTFRDTETLEFIAGDPNPTGVSYYIQPLPGTAVYTVKKSALDYYSLDINSFREKRFAYFTAKEAQKFTAKPRDGDTLVFEIDGSDNWSLLEPENIAADKDIVRRLLGRIAAMKARSFTEPDSDDYPSHIFASPPILELSIEMQDGTKRSIKILGRETRDTEELCWVQIEGEPTLYLSPASLIEEFDVPIHDLRDRSVLGLKAEDIKGIIVDMISEDGVSPSGHAEAVFKSGAWSWDDGVPIPGSTPSRLASGLDSLKVQSFDDSAREENNIGVGISPIHLHVITEDRVLDVFVGQAAPSIRDEEGHEYERYFMSKNDAGQVYIIDSNLVRVAQDFVREYNRKSKTDASQAERRERISEDGK